MSYVNFITLKPGQPFELLGSQEVNFRTVTDADAFVFVDGEPKKLPVDVHEKDSGTHYLFSTEHAQVAVEHFAEGERKQRHVSRPSSKKPRTPTSKLAETQDKPKPTKPKQLKARRGKAGKPKKAPAKRAKATSKKKATTRKKVKK